MWCGFIFRRTYEFGIPFWSQKYSGLMVLHGICINQIAGVSSVHINGMFQRSICKRGLVLPCLGRWDVIFGAIDPKLVILIRVVLFFRFG